MKIALVALFFCVYLTSSSIYKFKVAGLDGSKNIDFSKFKGKKNNDC